MVKCQETLGLKHWRAEGTGNPIGNFHASAKNKCHNKLVPHNIPEVYSKSLQCISALLRLLPCIEHYTEAKGILGGTQYRWEQGRSDSVYFIYFTSATVKCVDYLVHIRDFCMRFGLCFSFVIFFID